MRKTFLSTVAVAALITLPAIIAPSIATADDKGWYARAGIGYGSLEDTALSGGLNGAINAAGDLRPTIGFGRYLANDWRLDFDVTQRFNDTGDIGGFAFSSSDIQSWSGMINIIKDFDTGSAAKPYIGFGAGLSRTSLSAQGFQNGVLTSTFAQTTDSATNLAFNGLLGVGIDLSDNWVFDLGYRYFITEGVDAASNAGIVNMDTYQSHDVFAQLRFNFGGKKATPPPPPPPHLHLRHLLHHRRLLRRFVMMWHSRFTLIGINPV